MDTQTTVALELDEYYAAGSAFEKIRAAGPAMAEVVRNSGIYLHCNFILSPATTADDAAFFKQNPKRTHGIRVSNVDKYVTRGLETVAPFVVIRQVRPGARFICAVPGDSVLPEDAVNLPDNWFDDDNVLYLLFEFLCRHPGKPFAPHKLIAFAAQLKAGAQRSPGSAGRLS
jgi:hypothetical protein